MRKKNKTKVNIWQIITFVLLVSFALGQNSPEYLRDRIVLFARNRELSLFMGNNFTANPPPNSFGFFLKTSISLGNKWKAGTWHHIAFKWKKVGNGNNYLVGPVYLDGKPSFYTYTSEFSFNPIHWMFYGTNRFNDSISNGYPLTADATIQSIRTYSDSKIVDPSNKQGFLIPDRYEPSVKSTYEGTIFDFAARGAPKIKQIKILGISWTERIPADGGDIWIDLKVVRPKQVTAKNEDPYEIIKEFARLGKDGGNDYCFDSGGVKIEHTYPENCWSRQGVEIGLQPLYNDFIKITGNEKIILKAEFKLPPTVPVVESPHLEDVTISVVTTEPVILRTWEESKIIESQP
ncbi:MAG: hypothetical protein ACK4NF_05220 [Planctomycetota bacterium]